MRSSSAAAPTGWPRCAAGKAAGRKVLVLEARPRGRRCGTHGGIRARLPRLGPVRICSICSTRASRTGMDLARHGLAYAGPDTDLDGRCRPTGDHLVLDRAYGATHHAADLAAADRDAWSRAARAACLRFAGVLAPFKAMTPPRLGASAPATTTCTLAKLGLTVRMLGKDEFREFLRMLLINVADVLDDDLTDDRLKGLVAFDTTLGAWLGPRSPNSLILLLNRLAGRGRGRRRPLVACRGRHGRSVAAMAQGGRGMRRRLSAPMPASARHHRRERPRGGRHACRRRGDPRRPPWSRPSIPRPPSSQLVGPRHLDTGFVTRIRDIRIARRRRQAASGAQGHAGFPRCRSRARAWSSRPPMRAVERRLQSGEVRRSAGASR